MSESVELDINVVIHAGDGLLFGLSVEIQQLTEHLPLQTMMRIAGQLAQLEDQILLLSRVIVTTARGYPVDANPKYIRDVIAMFGLEDSRSWATASVKRTPTTESLVEPENDERAVYKHPRRIRCTRAKSTQTSCTAGRKQHGRSSVTKRAPRET